MIETLAQRVAEVRARFFPMTLPASVVAHPVDADTLEQIKCIIAPRIFPHDGQLRRFRTPPEREADLQLVRDMYAHRHRERFVLYSPDGEPVGWSYGQMEDYLTFYMHTMGLVPEYRGKGIYTAWLRGLCEYIGALGYERLTSHHQPNNRAVLIGKLKAGWVITGMELDESYGPLVKMAYYTHSDREHGFADVFSMRPPPKRGAQDKRA